MAQAPRRRRQDEPVDEFGGYSTPDAWNNAVEVYDPRQSAAPAAEETAKPPKRDALAAGFEAARSNLFEGLPYNLRRQFGELPQADQDEYLRKFRESAAKQEALLPGGPVGIGQIKDVKTFGQFLAENLAISAPQMGATIAGSLAGAAAGTGAAPGVGTVLGALGGAAASTPFYIGSNTAAATDQGQKPLSLTGAQRGAAIAPVQGLGDVAEELILPGVGKALGLPIRSAAKNVFLRAGEQGLKAGGLEYLTERGQQTGEQFAQERDILALPERHEANIAGLTGAILGGTIGVVGSPLAGKPKSQDIVEDTEPEPVADPAQPTDLMAAANAYQGGGGPVSPPSYAKDPADVYQGGRVGPDPDPQDINPEPPQTRAEDVIHGQAPAQPRGITDQRRASQLYGEAIADIESRGSGGYRARGIEIRRKNGFLDQALGKYQMMRSNLPQWTKKTFGHEVSEQEFLASPAVQDQVFDEIFGGYVRTHGVMNAVNMWFTGQPVGKDSGKGDPLGTTPTAYGNKFLAAMQRRGMSIGEGGRVEGGEGGTWAGGAPGPADAQLDPNATAVDLMARIKALTGEEPKKASVAGRIAAAAATDDAKADKLIETAKMAWQKDAADLEGNATLAPVQKAKKAAALDRRQRTLMAAITTVEQLRAARVGAVSPVPQPSEAEATLASQRNPNPALAAASERMASDGALDAQVAAAQPQPQPMDEASAKAMSAARAGYLKQVSENDIIGDKETALLNILGPDAEPLSAAEKAQLGMASRARILRQAQASTAQEPAAAAAAAEPIAPEPETEADTWTPEREAQYQQAQAAKGVTTPEAEAAAPAKPTNPREPAIRERATGRASGLGSSQKTGFWQGVDNYFGKPSKAEPPPPGTDREKWFNLGRDFAKTQDEELGGEPAAETEKKPETKPARTPKPKPMSEAAAEAAAERDSAPREKPQQEKADTTRSAQLQAGVRKQREERQAKEAETARVNTENKAARRAAEAAPPPVVRKPRAKKTGKPKGTETEATKAAITGTPPKPKKAKAPPKPEPEELTPAQQQAADAEKARQETEAAAAAAEKKLKAEIAAFEVVTERAANRDEISAFQRQNLDELADKTGNVELATMLLEVEKARFKKTNDATLGKGEPLANLMARAKEPAAAEPDPPQSKANVVPPAKPVPGVTVNEAPPLTATVEKLRPHLTLEEKGRLARAYGHPFFKEATLVKFAQDFVNFTNDITEGISKSVLAVAKRVQAAVLAVAIVFSPVALNTQGGQLNINLTPTANAATMAFDSSRLTEAAQSAMSDEALHTYDNVAWMATQGGKKGFVIPDKPNGMIHYFGKDAQLIASSPALYGARAGDVLTTAEMQIGVNDPRAEGIKITPAGTFKMFWHANPEYTGGGSLMFKDAKTGKVAGGIAIHAVYTGTASEKRLDRLASKGVKDNKVSYGCINTSNDFFLKQLKPHAAELEGAYVFVIPDVANIDAVFEPAPGLGDEARPRTAAEEKAADKQYAEQQAKLRAEAPAGSLPPPAPSSERVATATPKPEPPGLPPERARAAVAAGRRRATQRGRMRDLRQVAPSLKEKLTPSGQEKAAAWDKQLRAALDRRGLADVKLETTLSEKLDGDQGRFGATKDGLSRVIKVALDSANRGLTLDHEMVHALRDMGVIKPRDFDKLVKLAWSVPEIKAFVDEGYSSRPKFEQDGEAAAEFVARVINDPTSVTIPPEARGIIARIKQFISAIKDVWQGSDYKTVGELIAAIDSGEVGRKARTAEVGSTLTQGQELSRVRDTPQAKAVRSEVNQAASALDVTARDLGAKGIMMLSGTEDVANMAAKLGIKSAKIFVELHSKGHALARKFQARLVNIRDRTRALPAKYQGAGGLLSKLLHDSTNTGKWAFTPTEALGFPPGWASKAIVDPKLAERFNAMSPEAKQIIRDVFKFNYDAREQLHKATLGAINAEFDPIIDDKEGEFSDAEKVEAQEAKDRAIKYHSRLFNTQEALPYTPMKRTGAWAIVGKSAAYKAAVAAKDYDLIDKMRSDPAHYFVDFRETAREADKVREYVRGKFGKDNSYIFERGKTDQNAVSGTELLVAFKRMQAAMAVAGVGNKASAKMEQMARDFYLHSLSDESARKAELGRENVPGETMDMMEAFFTRGNASAEYAASIQNNAAIQKSLRDMQDEVSQSSAVNRTAASRFLNELMWRYEANLSAKPNRTVDRIVRATSLWTLLTSPFYYAQNFTQAVLISQPTLAARFGYAKTMAEFGRAYSDFSVMTKDIGWLDAVDYSKHPEPAIAKLLERLADRGRLDSGVTVEDNAAFVNGDGVLPKSWNRIDKFFRMMPQRVEVQNRVVTGIAAYRCAIAKGMTPDEAFEVASELIRTTHGDYSGFGSPRVFTQLGQFGKIAGQFRKFQLIMGSHVVREFNTMIRGATLEEKIMAAKSLAFLSAHMAAVGGVVGLPGMALMGPIIAAMLNAMDDDDDKDWSEWKQSLREKLGAGKEGENRNLLADFLFKGAPYALLHMDTSDRLGMGNMLALAPYTGLEEAGTDKEEWYAVMGKAMLGPSGKLVANTVGALDWGINHDDWSRMAEALGPGVVGTTAKALRLQREGLVDKGGLTLFQPEEISAYDKVLTAAGVNPRKLANQGEKVSERFKAEEFYKGKTGSLKRDFVRAKKDGDASQLQDIRQEWKDIQAARKRDGFKVQPMSELLSAPRELGKKQRQIIEGVSYTPATKGFVVQQMMADDDTPFDEDAAT